MADGSSGLDESLAKKKVNKPCCDEGHKQPTDRYQLLYCSTCRMIGDRGRRVQHGLGRCRHNGTKGTGKEYSKKQHQKTNGANARRTAHA